LKLAIEADGDTQFESEEAILYDKERQKYIEGYKINFLRFKNEEIFHHMDIVLEKINKKVSELL